MEKTGFAVPRPEPTALQTRRKNVPPSFHTLYFRDSILSVPGYVFEKVGLPRIVMYTAKSHVRKKAIPWEDTGSLTQLAEGSSLKDGSNVIAKIAPSHTNASVCLQREAHMYVTTLTPVTLLTDMQLVLLACRRPLKP
jgi:hypothetical protein